MSTAINVPLRLPPIVFLVFGWVLIGLALILLWLGVRWGFDTPTGERVFYFVYSTGLGILGLGLVLDNAPLALGTLISLIVLAIVHRLVFGKD